jgi:hypothetical protein
MPADKHIVGLFPTFSFEQWLACVSTDQIAVKSKQCMYPLIRTLGQLADLAA